MLIGKDYIRTDWLFLAAVTLAAVAQTVCAPPDESGPRHKSVVTCFNSVKDESASFCSGTCYQADGVLFKTGKMTCGWPGKVSEIEWTFLGRQGGEDKYHFTRRFPADSANAATTQKDVVFAGERVKVFEDQSQRIVVEGTRK